MRLLNCPKQEALLEFISVPGEMSLARRWLMKMHMVRCVECTDRMESLQTTWAAYFAPEPDITSSILRVYSSLQKDETLILKGWKLDGARPARGATYWLFQRGWLFRGGLSVGAFSLLAVALSPRFFPQRAEMQAERSAPRRAPFAQIRVEEKNAVKVRYVQPELLESMEFQTTSAR
jgi:hypothetical protein